MSENQESETVWLVELFHQNKSEGWWAAPPKDCGGWLTHNAWAAKRYTESEAKAVAAALGYFPSPSRWSIWYATEHVFIKGEYSRRAEPLTEPAPAPEQPAGAREFWRAKYCPTELPEYDTYTRAFLFEFAEAYAASQLGEREHEITPKLMRLVEAERELASLRAERDVLNSKVLLAKEFLELILDTIQRRITVDELLERGKKLIAFAAAPSRAKDPQ
jgi:hypothetical protein